MKNEFVTHDIALAMKELGFDEPCMSKYSDNGSLLLGVPQHLKLNSNVNKIEGMYLGMRGCTAPLYQQAFRWFREKYDMFSHLDKNAYSKYYYDIHNRGEIFFDEEYFNTPEEAELECLKKLIEIVNQNKDE